MKGDRRSNGRIALAAIVVSIVFAWLGLTPCRAQDPLADCDERVRRFPDNLLSYSCYNFVAMQQGLWAEASMRLEGHVAAEPRNTYALGALAYLDKARGRPRAEDMLRRILSIQAARGDTPLAESQWARLELVDFLAQRFRLDEADAVLLEALDEAEAAGDPAAIAQVRINQAWQSWRRADYAEAWSILRRVEEQVFPDGDPHARSIWLSAMGAVNWAQGAYDAARSNYQRQAEILAEFGDYYGRAGVLFNIALVATDREDGQDAAGRGTSLFESAREAAAAVGNAQVEAAALAELAGRVETVERRRELARQGLALARRANAVEAELANLRWLVISLATEEPIRGEEAAQLLAELEDRVREIGAPVERARLMALRTRLAWFEAEAAGSAQNATAAAVATHLQLLEAVESIRRLQPETLIRARAFSRWRGAYASLVSRALTPAGRAPTIEDLELAFRIMERTRSRLMLEEMDAARVTGALLDADDPRVGERRELLQEIAGKQRQLLDPSLDRRERSELLEQLTRLEYDEESARLQILRSSERLAALVEPEIPTLLQLQTKLSSDEALLTFQLYLPTNDSAMPWKAGSHLLVVTRDDVRAYDLPPAVEVHASIEMFVGLLGNRSASVYRAAAARLYDALLAEPLAHLDARVRRLLIAPDATLHRLPFSALLGAAGADPEDGPLPAITIVPSASTLVRWRGNAYPQTRRPVLGLFDPELPFDEPDSDQAMPAVGGDVSRALSMWGRRARLPGARAEARSIRRRLGDRVLSIEDRLASEHYLKQAPLADYAILHLAAHAVVDHLDPQRSFVLLAPGGGEDGLLQAREIADLDLDDKVVVLSACSGIAGMGIESEGVISLARAFLVSGARAVVGSLWPLRDEEAARCFDRFYARLAEGRPLDEALSLAQRDLAQAGVPAAAWSGLLVVGDGGVAPVEGREARGPRTGVIVLILLGVTAIVLAVKFLDRR